MLEILAEALIGALVERGLDAALAVRGDSEKVEIDADPKAAADALRDHLLMIEKWSSVISFRELLGTKQLAKSFIDLECQIGHLPAGGKPSREPGRPVSTLLQDREHVVLVGSPGAGKTTSLQRLALTALQRYDVGKSRTPLLIRLRDLAAEETLFGRLASLSTLRVWQSASNAIAESSDPEMVRAYQRRALSSYLSGLNAILFLDGLDECPLRNRPQLERDLSELMLHSSGFNIVLTCRTASYTYRLPAQVYSIQPLSDKQVQSFSIKWLGEERAESFINQLIHSPYKGAEFLPITLAHLCAIYERRGAIPPQPKFIYQKIVRLLLEEWDEQRGIQRTSRYAGFDVDRKLEFLRRIAYELTITDCRGSFSHRQLEQAYLKSSELFGLPAAECSRVAREIESHTGLILQAQDDTYEFAHKSLQEYLSAEYLLRLPGLPRDLLNLGEELAIMTALSSNAGWYVRAITEKLFEKEGSDERSRFAQTYLGRLMIERPDLAADESIGWSLIAFCDLAKGEPYYATYNPKNSANLMISLVNNSSTNPAFKKAFSNARRSIVDSGAAIISPREHVQLTPHLDGFFYYAPHRGIRVDRTVFEAMHRSAISVMLNRSEYHDSME